MNRFDNNIWQVAEAYIEHKLSIDELEMLNQKLAADGAFATSFYECVNIISSLQSTGRKKRFSSMLKNIHNDMEQEQQRQTKRVILFKTNHWRTAAIAATIACVVSLSMVFTLQQNNKHNSSSIYQELNSLKHKQVEQDKRINKIQDSLKQHAAPQADVFSSGTGFALTNDGYFITNFHVVNSADSVYIRIRNGEYFKAYTIAYDENTDLAIMKVEAKNFHFGKTDLPYAVATTRSLLGTHVYTLGYPQDDIVYNEGYISARTGFAGNANQYMLNLPSNPGQSGAPVLDAQANVIAIVAAHDKDNTAATYAVGIPSLQQLLHTMPRQMNLHLPKANKLSRLTREQQIDKLQDYVCLVQVYKK